MLSLSNDGDRLQDGEDMCKPTQDHSECDLKYKVNVHLESAVAHYANLGMKQTFLWEAIHSASACRFDTAGDQHIGGRSGNIHGQWHRAEQQREGGDKLGGQPGDAGECAAGHGTHEPLQ